MKAGLRPPPQPLQLYRVVTVLLTAVYSGPFGPAEGSKSAAAIPVKTTAATTAKPNLGSLSDRLNGKEKRSISAISAVAGSKLSGGREEQRNGSDREHPFQDFLQW
jgi:hypothetical protein